MPIKAVANLSADPLVRVRDAFKSENFSDGDVNNLNIAPSDAGRPVTRDAFIRRSARLAGCATD